MIRLNPYLNFRDTAREAMEFYQSVFGGELSVMPFSSYEMGHEASEGDKTMHAQLETPDGLTLMAADTPNSMDYSPGTDFAVSVSGDDEGALRGWWDQLADGGTVSMPLSTPEWGGTFGMLTDRFGISWLFSIDTPEAA